MATRQQLKEWFSDLKKPNQNHFGEWIDSYWHKTEKIPAKNIEGLDATLQDTASNTQFQAHLTDLQAHKELFDQLHTELQNISQTTLPSGGFTGTAQELKETIDNILIILKSPDTELDNLREIVAYIKQNKEILSTLGISNIAGLVEALETKATKNHNHNDLYYTKEEVLELTNKTPLMTGLTHFKTTKVFTDAWGGGVQYGNTTLLIGGENQTIEIIKEAARKIFRYIKLGGGEVNFTSSAGDSGGPFVVAYTTPETILRNGGEAIVVVNGTNTWITIRNNDNKSAGIGLSEGDRQLLTEFKAGSENLIKKRESEDVLLANGTTLSKEELKGEKGEPGLQGEAGKSAYDIAAGKGFQGTEEEWIESLKQKNQEIPDEDFEFKFLDNWLQWKFKSESDWKKLIENYDFRLFDNQTLDAKVENNRIFIKRSTDTDDEYKELLMGQWHSAFKYKFVDNQAQWFSGLSGAEWTDMPFLTTEDVRKNTEGNMMIRVNTLRYVESGQEKLINVSYPEKFNVKILDGNYLQWKKTTEDDTKWKRLPFHSENFHRKYGLNGRVQNGVIQYKFEFENDTEYKDLIKASDLLPVDGIKIIDKKNTIGDTRAWLNLLFMYHRNILIKSGTYELQPITRTGINVQSKSNITFEENAIFKVKPNPLPHFNTLSLRNVNDVTIRGGLLIGDKDEHIWMNPREDNYFYRMEQIHGIAINSSSNIIIENIKTQKFIGDGIVIHRANNLYMNNVKLFASRMENLGIRGSENLTFNNCEFSFASPATASNFRNLGYGVDIEPLYNRDHFINIRFLNCVFENNYGFENVGLTLSTAQHGAMRYEYDSKNEFEPTNVSIELVNPVFKDCGMLIKISSNWTHGYIRITNATIINSKRFGLAFYDHNSENFHTYVDGLKLIDCATELHYVGGENQYYSRPLCFYSSPGKNAHIEQQNQNQTVGTRNISIKNVEIINSGKVRYQKAAVSVYANPNKQNDLMNVKIENLKVIGYQKIFENLSLTEIHKSFSLTQHNENDLLNAEIVNNEDDIILKKDSVHTYINKKVAGNIIFKDEIYPSNLEYYIKNSSIGEVKLKFESATDIEGLVYGVQEFTLARGKRIKMRKIAANRWEYLEGTA